MASVLMASAPSPRRRFLGARRLRRAFWCALALLACLVAPSESAAHPAGLTSINRYIGIKCDARGTLHIAYHLDFAELPSYTEFELLDADHDGTVTPDEQRAYLDRRVPPLIDRWVIRVNGRPASAR